MADNTAIEWTDATWNVITGCSQVSDGCSRCYAMKLAGTRLRNHPSRQGLTKQTARGPVWTGDVRFNEQWLDQPLRWKRPRRIFVCAHGDLFHEAVPDEWIDKVFAVMAQAPQHTFKILTKRPKRMRRYCCDSQTPFRVARQIDVLMGRQQRGPEELQPIAGYPGYLASSHGYIYSEKRGRRRKMKPDTGTGGHQRVQLHRGGSGKRGDRLLVHRIILETFVSQPPSPTAQGRHRDGDPSNNAVSNLLWGSQVDNRSDALRHGTFRRYSKLSQRQSDEIRQRHADGETGEALAREFGVSATQIRNIATGAQWGIESPIEWPLSQCWLGVSVENQTTADERIPRLLATPAAVRFVSYEPARGPVDFVHVKNELCVGEGLRWLDTLRGDEWESDTLGHDVDAGPIGSRLDLVIAGGESGPGARPAHPDWFRMMRDQCQAAGVPFFFKQWGAWTPTVPATWPDPDGWVSPDGRFTPSEREALKSRGSFNAVWRVGKAKAGHLLDGVEHREWPEATP